MHWGFTIRGAVAIVAVCLVFLPGVAPRFAVGTLEAAPSTEPNASVATPIAPRLHCDAPVFDFGIGRQGEVVTHSFRLVNTSLHPARIVLIRTSCGCTTATESGQSIAPGSSTSVQVVLNLTSAGPKRSTVMIGEDGSEISLELRLVGEVLGDVIVLSPNPAEVALGATNYGASVRRYLDLGSSHRQTPLRLAVAPAGWNAKVEPISSRYQVLTLTASSELKLGEYSGEMRLCEGADSLNCYVLRLSAQVVSDLYAVPGTISVSSANTPTTVFVTVASRIGRPFRLIQVRTPKGITVEFADEPQREVLETRLRLVLPASPVSLAGKSIALITADSKRSVEIRFVQEMGQSHPTEGRGTQGNQQKQ